VRTETRNDKYYMREAVKTLYDSSMGPVMDKYAANGRFFTQQEFEANKGQIFILSGARSKADNIIDKMTD